MPVASEINQNIAVECFFEVGDVCALSWPRQIECLGSLHRKQERKK